MCGGSKHIPAALMLMCILVFAQVSPSLALSRSLSQEEEWVEGPSSSEGVTILANVYIPPPASEIPIKPKLPISAIPQYNRTEWYTQGPVKSLNIEKSAPSGDCMTIGEVLKEIGAEKFYKILADTGLKSSILDDPKVQTTLLVPLDYTFFKEIDATPLRNESTMDELVYYAPEIKRPLAGASILQGLWPTDALGTSMKVPTSNTMDKENPLVIIVEENKVLQAENGNAVKILQGDIAACGPSIIHIVDDIVLPFSFDQKPVDAVSGTQAVKP